MIGALGASFVGYYYAYRAIFWVKDVPGLPGRQMWAVVTAGFARFLSYGGSALDDDALRAAGAGQRDAKVRVSALSGLEYGVLAIGGCAAAIAILLVGPPQPPGDFTTAGTAKAARRWAAMLSCDVDRPSRRPSHRGAVRPTLHGSTAITSDLSTHVVPIVFATTGMAQAIPRGPRIAPARYEDCGSYCKPHWMTSGWLTVRVFGRRGVPLSA